MNDLTIEEKEIQKKLKPVTDVDFWTIDFNLSFSLTFAQVFRSDMPSYQINEGVVGATRSNWTYHTAYAMTQTCKILDLICKFECHGKRDAVIETRDDKPEIILFAEWEWDYEDIFGKGKELEKLKNSCKQNKSAEAFLLVYCPNDKFVDYLYRIAGYWIKSFSKLKNQPALFLHTILFENKKTYREFERLKTVVISPAQVLLINDWNL